MPFSSIARLTSVGSLRDRERPRNSTQALGSRGTPTHTALGDRSGCDSSGGISTAFN